MTGTDPNLNMDEALRSSLERLPVAVVIVDHANALRPMNRRGHAFFEAEGLQNDLLSFRPSHPLSQLIREVLEVPAEQLFEERTIRFPSGQRYSIEPSRPSAKGRGRWTMLLVSVAKTPEAVDESLLDEWELTPREREVAKLLMRGLPSREIAAAIEVTDNTVKSHIARILEKSGSRTRAGFLAKLLGSR